MAINRVISAAARGRDLREHVAGWSECLVSRIDDDLSLAWMNPTVEEMYRLAKLPKLDSVSRLPSVMRLRDEDGVELEPGAQIKETLRSGLPVLGQVREVEAQSGARFWHESSTVPILNGSRVVGVLWLSWMLGDHGQVPVHHAIIPPRLRGLPSCRHCTAKPGDICEPGEGCPVLEKAGERERVRAMPVPGRFVS